MNQPDGFDCPGCAWPEPPAGERSRRVLRERREGASPTRPTARAPTPAFFARHTVADLAAARSDHWLGAAGPPDRADVRCPGRHALRADRVGRRLRAASPRAARARSTRPTRRLFYTSGRTSNEAAFLYQLFVRELGTNNLPDCSNMCHESSGVGAAARRSASARGRCSSTTSSTPTPSSIIGQNPGTNHPRMLDDAAGGARGAAARSSAINPLPEAALVALRAPAAPAARRWAGGTPIADAVPAGARRRRRRAAQGHHEGAARRGGAPAAAHVVDHAFIASTPTGSTAFAGALAARAVGASWSSESGIAARRDARGGRAAGAARTSVIACWAMGLTQHEHAIANIQEVVEPAAAARRRSAGRARASARCAATATCRAIARWASEDRPAPRSSIALGARVRLRAAARARPRRRRRDRGDARRPGARCLLRAGRQLPLGHARHRRAPPRALRGCALTAHVVDQAEPRAPRDRARGADPARASAAASATCRRAAPSSSPSRTRWASCTRSQGVLRAGRRERCAASPPSSPAWRRRCSARARACAGTWLAEDYDRIRDDIAAVIPGFEDFNARVRSPAASSCRTPVRERRFPHRDGRARFTVHPRPRAPARARPAAADDHPQPRPVQHDDLRPRRSLPRHPRRPARRLHERGRHPRARAASRGCRRPRQPVPRRDAHRAPASPWSPTRSRAAPPPPTSPRRTRSCRSAASPPGSRTPASKSIIIEVTPSAPP